ncbi:DUF4747 family protein [Halomarina oriensis]|uniref:DUF4747 family protein n=1 Tax=Halomarina oriensis TaxID=671145 RepID=A0A6B0GKE4_9EURY|nr:DUF4747 family protein [Halomarina oriensis]MWG33889.1 DUF4747 family protein [Halomarina oriensis]
MVDTTFYFARYNVKGTLTTLTEYDASKSRADREREVLERYIRTDGEIAEGENGTWYFGKVEPEQNYDLGKFGKVYSEEPTTYDKEEGDFVEDTAPNQEADYSMFLLHYEDNLLIYNTKNRIGHEQFLKYFSEGFNSRHEGDVSIELSKMHNTDSVEWVVNQKRVREASFELEPSNPSSHPDWENLDEEIQKMLAKRLSLMAESKDGANLNMDEELLEQAVEMAQTRYGLDYRIVYDDNGYAKTVTKHREPVQKGEERPDTLGGLQARAGELIGYARSFMNQDG